MPDAPLVVLDALLVSPEPTGVGRAALELARALAREGRGLRFAVLATHPDLFDFVADAPGWRVVPCPGARGGSLAKAAWTQVVLPRVARRLGAALVHSLQFAAPLGPGMPSVVTVHDLTYRLYPETIETPRRLYYRAVVPASLRRAAAVVTNSDATAADVREAFPDLAARVHVTPFGTPSWVWERSAAAPPSARAPYLFVGTLEPRKNLPRLLEAYRLLAARAGADLPGLVLAGGRGWRDSPLREPIRDLEERGLLRLEGYCRSDRLWDLYGSARALLFPSLHEGFGFPILEAMAAGLPVLTADRGAMREVAGEAALLADPLDVAALAAGLERIHRDEALRARLIRLGRARAREWSWERTAAATVAVYRRVLASGPGRRDEIAVAVP